jgi:hypothetical protein
MTSPTSKELKDRLGALGLNPSVVDAVWPAWWSEEAEASPSARTELRFGVSRRLGIDPRSLLGADEEPRFLWGGREARFKNLSDVSEVERTGLTSFGRAVASVLLQATPPASRGLIGTTAQKLRDAILAGGRDFVDLQSLLTVCWGVGVPVAYLRVFPWSAKRMAAMTVRVGDRSAILLGRDSEYPAPVAFHLAHEMGHIGLHHLSPGEAIVNVDPPDRALEPADEEEDAADRFALELLTGRPDLEVTEAEDSAAASPTGLADVVRHEGPRLHIEPGTLALCFGYSTQKWDAAFGALKAIYASPAPAWEAVNEVAGTQLELDSIAADASRFLTTVLDAPAE